MLKKFLSKIILVVAGFCIAILLAEVFVRIFYPECRAHVMPSGWYETDNYLGWRLAKNKTSYHRSKYFDVVYNTNSLGFRDKERVILKEPEKFRILLYGDSQIFGWGLSNDNRISNLLEGSLSNIEIWNLAVPGYGLDQQVLSYQENPVEANVVIFYVSEYTLERINYYNLYQKSKPKFVIDELGQLKIKPPKAPGMLSSLVNSTIRWMYLPFFLEEKISLLNGKPEAGGHIVKSILKTESNVTEIERRIILFAQSLVNSRNDRMVILLNSYFHKGQTVKDFCLQNGILYLDININEKNNNLILGSADYHWNGKANKIILSHILPEIESLLKKDSKLYYLNN